MRIGFLSEEVPYLPSRDGFRIHAANLIRCLSSRHAIDLISLQAADDEPYIGWAKQYCASVTTIPKRHQRLPRRLADFFSAYCLGRHLHFREQLRSRLEGGLAHGKWDVFHVEGSFVAGLVPCDLPVPKVLALHDSCILRCEEMLKCSLPLRERAYYALMRCCEPRYERLVYPRFDRCTVVSTRDQAAVQGAARETQVAAIPSGTDTEYFYPLPVAKEAVTLVFHGNLGYWPNVGSAQELANRVLPLVQQSVPDTLLHLVGAKPAPEIVALGLRPDIRLSADLPDLRPAVCSGRVYVCAVRRGSGMKNKILEAMAMQLPVVSCPEALIGINCVPGEHVLIADTPEQMAASVLELLRRPEFAFRIAAGGRKFVEERYSWNAQSRRYETLYQEVINERRAWQAR